MNVFRTLFCTIIHPKVLLYGISISVRGKNCAEIFRPLLNTPMRPEDFFINIYLYTLQLKLLPPKTRMLRNTRCVSVEKASRACKQSALPARVFVAKWRLIRRPFCSLQLHIPRKKKKKFLSAILVYKQLRMLIAKDALQKHFFIKSQADCGEITAHVAPQTTPQNRPCKPPLNILTCFQPQITA